MILKCNKCKRRTDELKLVSIKGHDYLICALHFKGGYDEQIKSNKPSNIGHLLPMSGSKVNGVNSY